MNEHDFDQQTSVAERAHLAAVGDRLERERPLPSPAFRGDLRRRLTARSRPGPIAAARRRVLVATYSGLGGLLLAVAALGLVGVGPFGA